MAKGNKKNSQVFQYRWQLDGAGGPTWLGPDTVRFRVWAPHGEQLWIEFKDREPVELFRETDAAHFWTAEVAGVTPGDEYRVKIKSSWNDCYHAEGEQLFRRDPYARQAEFDSAWCFLTNPRFSWQPLKHLPTIA